MREKVRDSRGETLVEVLASIIIGTLSVTLLYGAVMASARIGEGARRMDGSYYAALSAAETQSSPMADSPPNVRLRYTADGVEQLPPLAIALYGGKDAASYALLSGGGGP